MTPGSDEHDAAVRQFLEVMGINAIGGKLIDQVLNTLVESYKKGLPQIPDAVWGEMRNQFSTEEFANLQVALYKKHFSFDEIRGLTAFLQTPLGQRLLEEQPGLFQDGKAIGQEIARKAADKLKRCLQQKGYTVS